MAELEKQSKLGYLMSSDEIMNAIRELKLYKASGPDTISGEMIKPSALVILHVHLTMFYPMGHIQSF